MSLKKSNRKPDYAVAVTTARSARITNGVLCAVGCALLLAAVAACFFLARDYVPLAASVCATLLIPLVALLVKSFAEVRAIERIAQTGVYAAKLSEMQQEEMRDDLLRQGRQFYLTAFLCIAFPEAIVLTVMNKVLKNDLFLLIMAIFTLACLAVACLASLYLGARLRVRRPFCTVSPKGVLTSREVLPFDAKKKEVLSLVRFDDFFRIEFVKTEILGIRHRASVIVPTDGVLKNGVGGDPNEIMARTLGLRRITIIHSDFYESLDYSEETVNALAAAQLRGDAARI